MTSNGSGVGTWQAAPSPNLWKTINADSGNTSADTPTDTLSVAGSGSVATVIAGDTLTITGIGGNILEKAYDQGGAGAGRTITADSGS